MSLTCKCCGAVYRVSASFTDRGGLRERDAAGIVALRNAAEDLIAVALAARDRSAGCAPWDHEPCGQCSTCTLDKALAALDAKMGDGK